MNRRRFFASLCGLAALPAVARSAPPRKPQASIAWVEKFPVVTQAELRELAFCRTNPDPETRRGLPGWEPVPAGTVLSHPG